VTPPRIERRVHSRIAARTWLTVHQNQHVPSGTDVRNSHVRIWPVWSCSRQTSSPAVLWRELPGCESVRTRDRGQSCMPSTIIAAPFDLGFHLRLPLIRVRSKQVPMPAERFPFRRIDTIQPYSLPRRRSCRSTCSGSRGPARAFLRAVAPLVSGSVLCRAPSHPSFRPLFASASAASRSPCGFSLIVLPPIGLLA